MQHLVIQPLLGFDFTELIITAIVLIAAVIKQLFDASSKTAKKTGPMMPAQPPQRAVPGGPKPVPAGGQQADALRSQVEEFLRRAGGQPQTNQAPPPTLRPVSEIELLVRQPQRQAQLPSAAAGEKQRTGRRSRRR